MTSRTWIAAFAVAATLGVGATAASAKIPGSRGPLYPTTQSGSETGSYRLAQRTRARATVDRIVAVARGLDVTGATRANRPAFHVFLTKSDGTGAADFGQMRVNRRGDAKFLFDSRRTSFPAGVTTITDYSGGTIEVRDASDSAVLSATLGSF